jgi:hypothetical protein
LIPVDLSIVVLPQRALVSLRQHVAQDTTETLRQRPLVPEPLRAYETAQRTVDRIDGWIPHRIRFHGLPREAVEGVHEELAV